MIIRTFAYVCDKCHKSTAAVDLNVFDLPSGWQSEKNTYSLSYANEKHICPSCIEKKEIRETFK